MVNLYYIGHAIAAYQVRLYPTSGSMIRCRVAQMFAVETPGMRVVQISTKCLRWRLQGCVLYRSAQSVCGGDSGDACCTDQHKVSAVETIGMRVVHRDMPQTLSKDYCKYTRRDVASRQQISRQNHRSAFTYTNM